jgi:electron transfer flavoprotein-quinone oxidoreductase
MEMALTVKELRRLTREAIDSRFGVSGDDGVTVEATGSFAEGIPGTGYIYTNTNSLSVGVACPLACIVENDVTPSELLDRFKQHPAIRPLLEGSEVARFAAQLLPEGGYRSRPSLFGDGWITCGDAAQVNDALHREGSTMALTSGRLAAETIIELKRHGRPMTARHLSLYRDKLEQSSVLKEFRKDRHVQPASQRDSSSVSTDPRVLARGARTLVANPGFGARATQKELLRSFSRHRALNELISDAI